MSAACSDLRPLAETIARGLLREPPGALHSPVDGVQETTSLASAAPDSAAAPALLLCDDMEARGLVTWRCSNGEIVGMTTTVSQGGDLQQIDADSIGWWLGSQVVELNLNWEFCACPKPKAPNTLAASCWSACSTFQPGESMR